MEESHDMGGNGDMLPPEKGKRKLKTPAQLEALEKFYNDHKYPSEPRKLQFAKQVGLSEKQVSGWFCHRRLKDKKLLQGDVYVSEKQSVSNGAIHDRASGLRQESCSSTKQGDRPFDSKEVESKTLYSHSSSAAVLVSQQADRHIQVEHHTVGDDRSSGSCSASQDMMLQKYGDPCTEMPSRYSSQDNDYLLTKAKGAKHRGQMLDSRYTHLQCETEDLVVASVKRKLGLHYREDGPSVGVVFDPLPPGAFDSPIRDANYDPYYVAHTIQRESSIISRIMKKPKVYEKYKSETLSNELYPEVGFTRKLQGYHHYKESTRSHLVSDYPSTKEHKQRSHLVSDYPSTKEHKQRSHLASDYPSTKEHKQRSHLASDYPSTKQHKQHDHISSQMIVMGDNNEDFLGKAFDYKSRKKRKCFKNKVLGGSNSDIDHHIQLNGQKANTSKSFSYPNPNYNRHTPVFQRDEYEAEVSKLLPNNNHDSENTMWPRRPIKKGKIHQERTTLENDNPIRQGILTINAAKAGIPLKNGRTVNNVQLQAHEHLSKYSEKFRRTKATVRYSRDMAPSFSEDETGGSDTSVD